MPDAFYKILTEAIRENQLAIVRKVLDLKKVIPQIVERVFIDNRYQITEEMSRIFVDSKKLEHFKDISVFHQHLVRAKIREYLVLSKRDPKFVGQFEEGYCGGIVSLWLYSKWLSITQPDRDKNNADDNEWFRATIDAFMKWDGQQVSIEQAKQFERFISLVQLLQDPHLYFPNSRQGELDKLMEDEHLGATQRRIPKQEYAIGSLFTLEQLKIFLLTQNVIQENRLIYIGSHNHATALFMSGNQYYYFDSNSGEMVITDLDKVAEMIFRANMFDFDKPSPLHFRIFSLDEPRCLPYPVHQDILRDTGLTRIRDTYADGYTGLMMAIRSGSIESVRYFLEHGDDPNLRCSGKDNAFDQAINLPASFEILQELLKSDKATSEFASVVLQKAVEANQLEVVKAALRSEKITVHAISDALTKTDKLETIAEILGSEKVIPEALYHPLRKAVICGQTELVKAMVESTKAIPDIVRITLEVAVEFDKLKVVEELLQSEKVTTRFVDGALQKAAPKGFLDVIKVLIYSEKATLEIVNKFLRRAVLFGKIEIVKTVLESGKVSEEIISEVCGLAKTDEMKRVLQATISVGPRSWMEGVSKRAKVSRPDTLT